MKNEKNALSFYVCPDFPYKGALSDILPALHNSPVDFVEIGLPYSDPLADGGTIQEAAMIALRNGCTIQGILDELKALKSQVNFPMVLMGYFNSVFQYGIEKLCKQSYDLGITQWIIPDFPPDLYEEKYKDRMDAYGVGLVFLVCPETEVDRMHYLGNLSKGFLYAVSSSSTTGGHLKQNGSLLPYVTKLREAGVQLPICMGFGIHDASSLQNVYQHGMGAIIGSAFIRAIATSRPETIKKDMDLFIHHLCLSHDN